MIRMTRLLYINGEKKQKTKQTNAKRINCKQETSNKISAQIRRSNHKQSIRKSRIPIPTWQKKLRSNCQPKKFPAKPVRLFYKVTSHRTEKEMTEEKKYESRDDDGNINFTREHQLDDTDDMNRVNTKDRDERSILQNQDGGQYQGEHTASSWAYNNQTCTMILPGSVAYNFPSFSGLHQVFVPTNTYLVYNFPAM